MKRPAEGAHVRPSPGTGHAWYAAAAGPKRWNPPAASSARWLSARTCVADVGWNGCVAEAPRTILFWLFAPPGAGWGSTNAETASDSRGCVVAGTAGEAPANQEEPPHHEGEEGRGAGAQPSNVPE